MSIFLGIYLCLGFIISIILFWLKFDKMYRETIDADPNMYAMFYLFVCAFWPYFVYEYVKEKWF